ncbi:MAG: co-chaperone YbbN [Rhodobacteraceae bacterium]|nr:co-chaperone YbbN [Paracoccaceae bacterium]
MLGLRKSGESHVKEGSDATFMQDVVEASRSVPVLAYFTAKWCGPCKTLGPQLEAEVNKAAGRAKLVRIDVDKNQSIAAQLQVQSVPAVFAFADGRPVNGFVGAKRRSELAKFIQSVIRAKGHAPGSGMEGTEELLAHAEELLKQGALVEASRSFSAILAEEPENAAAYAGLIKTHIACKDIKRAEGLLQSLPSSIADSQAIASARAMLELAKQARSTGPVYRLRRRVEANPNDHQARLDLATALHASGDIENAIEHLLELFRRDRAWNDEAAKKQLFKVFDSQDPAAPIVLKARRRLSSMIFS